MSEDDKLWIAIGVTLWAIVFWLYIRSIDSKLDKILAALVASTTERSVKGSEEPNEHR